MSPTYPIQHKETGEQKELSLSIQEWEEWREKNPEWFRFFTPENSPGFGEVGDWKDKNLKNNPGWKEVLKKVEKSPGKKAKNLY